MKKLTIILMILFCCSGEAKEFPSFNAYIGAGLLYELGTVRIGFSSLEFGLLNGRIFGVDKRVSPSDGHSYYSFGAGIIRGPDSSFGIYGGYGYDWPIVWGLGIRLELSGAMGANGYSYGEVLAGISWGI